MRRASALSSRIGGYRLNGKRACLLFTAAEDSIQVLSYLRLSGCKVGLLINFNVTLVIKEGLVRMVNGFPE